MAAAQGSNADGPCSMSISIRHAMQLQVKAEMLILCEDMTSDHRPKIFKKIEEVRGGNQIHKIMLLCFRFLRCTHTYTTAIRLPHVHIHILADFCSSSSSPTLLVDCRQWI
jgi:hypothetical protein